MDSQYTYEWFISQFANTKNTAEEFILSVDEQLFLQTPAEGRWSIAECYDHLINYGDLYFGNIQSTVARNSDSVSSIEQPFPPRWLPQKVIRFFEPPYKIKLKTIKPMKPGNASELNRMELLDEYLNLQDRLITLLEEAHRQRVHLGKAKVPHPIFSFITMTLAECFLLLDAHQQRHQWQAEQTLKALKEHTTNS